VISVKPGDSCDSRFTRRNARQVAKSLPEPEKPISAPRSAPPRARGLMPDGTNALLATRGKPIFPLHWAARLSRTLPCCRKIARRPRIRRRRAVRQELLHRLRRDDGAVGCCGQPPPRSRRAPNVVVFGPWRDRAQTSFRARGWWAPTRSSGSTLKRFPRRNGGRRFRHDPFRQHRRSSVATFVAHLVGLTDGRRRLHPSTAPAIPP